MIDKEYRHEVAEALRHLAEETEQGAPWWNIFSGLSNWREGVREEVHKARHKERVLREASAYARRHAQPS